MTASDRARNMFGFVVR